VLILRQLIDSGEINILSHHETRDGQLPKISKGPDMKKLRETELYNQIKSSSGFGQHVDEEKDFKWNLIKTINARQNAGSFVRSQKCKINNTFVPNHCSQSLAMLTSKVFCGNFNSDGSRFATGSQDQVVRIFDSSTENYQRINFINAKCVSWCLLDIAFSPCDKYFAYSTWSDCLHICPVDGDDEDVRCLNLNTTVNRFGGIKLIRALNFYSINIF
jgi:WD repeat-containing protein 23